MILQELGYLSESVTSLDTALHFQYRIRSTLGLRDRIYCRLISQGLPHGSMSQILDAKNQLKKFCKLLDEALKDVTDKPNGSFINWIDLLTEKTAHTQSHSHTTHAHSHTTQTHSHTTAKCHSNPHSSNVSAIEILISCIVKDISLVMDDGVCRNKDEQLLVEKKLKSLKETKPKITVKCKGCSTVPPGTREGKRISATKRGTDADRPNTNNICPSVHLLFYPRPTCPEKLLKNLTITKNPPLTKSKKPSRYTEAYRSMEFMPLSVLSPSVEELVFQNKTPSVDYNDPYWPNKAQCLEVVEGLNDNLPRFTGTFLTPEAHGIK